MFTKVKLFLRLFVSCGAHPTYARTSTHHSFRCVGVGWGGGRFFQPKSTDTFLFFHEINIYCAYSLEAPRRGASNEYHNICFRG